jgi:hypothetical protein
MQTVPFKYPAIGNVRCHTQKHTRMRGSRDVRQSMQIVMHWIMHRNWNGRAGFSSRCDHKAVPACTRNMTSRVLNSRHNKPEPRDTMDALHYDVEATKLLATWIRK